MKYFVESVICSFPRCSHTLSVTGSFQMLRIASPMVLSTCADSGKEIDGLTVGNLLVHVELLGAAKQVLGPHNCVGIDKLCVRLAFLLRDLAVIVQNSHLLEDGALSRLPRTEEQQFDLGAFLLLCLHLDCW